MDWIIMTYLGQLGLVYGELFISLLYIFSVKKHPYFSINQMLSLIIISTINMQDQMTLTEKLSQMICGIVPKLLLDRLGQYDTLQHGSTQYARGLVLEKVPSEGS